MKHLIEIIKKSVDELIKTQVFSSWFSQEKPANDDIVMINNSFIYRKDLIKTSKNPQYLCLKIKNGQVDIESIFIGSGISLNSDFKLLSTKSSNLSSRESLDQALQREIKQIGRLIFVLIGKLRDNSCEVPIRHRLVKKLRFEPTAKVQADLIDTGSEYKTIIISQLTDPESAWNNIKSKLNKEAGDELSNLESAFGEAFEKLQNQARLSLVLPEQGTTNTDRTFIAQLLESVSAQRKLYEEALKKWRDKSEDTYQREVMRIAYNFADDAIKVLTLLVSISDIKGILLWCTINEHFSVAQAFRNLPWTKSRKKPSLKSYREIIAGARNHAFHNLLAFDRTIEAPLQGVSVKARRLTLLPPYRQRKETIFLDYEDREMVEILSELTRAPEVAVYLDFWNKNAQVMEEFERLLERTEQALWSFNGVQGDVL